jgi:hypothetical protein
MEPALQAFRGRHAEDHASRLVDVLLAWLAMERGDLRGAATTGRRLQRVAGPGTLADLARTLEGASLRREGAPDRALDLLLPLESKLIDPWARSIYNQEVVEAAVEARRWPVALATMRVWLREAGSDERATARASIEESLTRVPSTDLLALLETVDSPVPSADEDLEMRKLVAQRLAVVARSSKDAQLAQRLLTRAGGLLGDQGDVVAQLAVGASRARVEARTVGLVLSLRDDATRRRGAELAQGVAFGLGLPGSAARLVSRDDQGSPERVQDALAALSAEGASVLIAGSDEGEANAAAAFASANHVPVLLLRPAPRAKDARFSFVVGLDAAEPEASLVTALVARGAATVGILADDPARPRVPRAEVVAVRGCGDAGASWKSIGAIVLSAGVDCARDAVASVNPLAVRFAAGFTSAGITLPPGSVIATAGAFPFVPGAPQLRIWSKDHPAPPSFWAALGRDAAVLAWEGVRALPAQGTEDPAEVEARRAHVAAALAAARTPLWTTEADGFHGGRTLSRTIGVRDVPRAQP